MDNKKCVLTKSFALRCPTCRQQMTYITDIIFTNNFTFVVLGECCGSQITSGECNILEYIPMKPGEKGN